MLDYPDRFDAVIRRLGYVRFLVRDLCRSWDFYVNIIGLHETERTADSRVFAECRFRFL